MPTFSIYNKCNNNCIMCTNFDKFCNNSKKFDLVYLLRRIDRFYKGEEEFLDNYRDAFSITGGEPTLSPNFLTIIKKINSLFPEARIMCLTNGRMFFYEDYIKELLQLDDHLELAISIHGHTAKIHDSITQTKGSFFQTVKGLQNIFRFKKRNHIIEIRIVIHQLNYKILEKITTFIKNEFPLIDRLVYIFFEIEGQARKNLERLNLSYTEFIPYINNIYNLIQYFNEVRFYHFPLCVVPRRLFPFIWRTLPALEISFLKRCKGCNLKAICLGIPKGYLKYIGQYEFKPIKDKINIKEGSNWHHPINRIYKGNV